MDIMLGQQDSLKSVEALTRRVSSDAKRQFERVADDQFLERAAAQAVEELWQDSVKVTSFIPVLAMRRVREVVASRQIAQNGVSREP